MSPSNLTVEAWPVTDAGQADENEDFVLVHQPADEDVARFSGSLYIVADGQGGGTRGQIASRYAAERVMYQYYNDNEPDLGLRLRQAIARANSEIYEYAQDQPELVRLGTTLVAAVVRGEQLHVAAVGDSRAYIIRDGKLRQITRDHTLVQQLLDEGAITPEEAREHPRRDVVLRTIGSQPEISADVYDMRLGPDDALLLCTDGLTRYMHEDEITRIVGTSSPRNAAETLVQKAVDRGGKDNVSVVSLLARAGAPPLETNLPHTWDGSEPSFEAMPTMAMRRTPREGADTEAAAAAAAGAVTPDASLDQTIRSQPVSLDDEGGTPPDATKPVAPVSRGREVPAPRYESSTEPAPPYGMPGGDRPEPPAGPIEGAGQGPEPPDGYTFDPVTGLPPVPPGRDEPSRQPYQPRVYQPPSQPEASRRPPQRGVSVGLFAAVGLIAILLTALMIVLLVNPMGWNLPVGGPVEETPVAEEPTIEVEEPALVTTNVPAVEATEVATEAVTEEAAVDVTPTVENAPEGMVLVDGGPFTRGVTDEEAEAAQDSCVEETAGEGTCLLEYFTDAQPVESVTVAAFFMDIQEVTNAQYAECVAAGVCSAPQNVEFYDDPAFANHPVVYINYDQAGQYCQWTGGRLPTEAEWEKAARWDETMDTSYTYPWGDNWEAGRANTDAAGLGGLAAVGSFARDRSPYGMLDMAGNATEWVQDWYYPSYEGLGTLNPARLGAQPLTDPLRVGRGGSFQAIAAYSRAGHRYDVSEQTAEAWLGVRCVQDTAQAADAPDTTTTPEAGLTPTGTEPAGETEPTATP